jgi:hypothetical protein
MSDLRYQQSIVDDVKVSEVWGLLDAAPSEKHHLVAQEWVQRHAARAQAKGFAWSRASVHAKDEGHLLFEAWRVRPDDEGKARWAKGGDK